ncbi:MAG: restriction endonuclease subunit S [Betaproteobacteria bacterium]
MAGDWVSRTFGECAELVYDTVLPGSVAGAPYIGLEHIGEGTLSLVGCGQSEDVSSVKLRFRRGDILFGKLRPYFRKVIRAPFDGVCSTDIWVVRPKESVDAGYLHYLMASPEFIEAATRGSEGTKMPRAKWDFVTRIAFPVPSLPEQRAIAHILGTLDAKIELNRRMNETLEAMARALFKSWFVDYEPVRAKMEGRWRRGECLVGLPSDLYDLFPDRLVESELGEIPEGWEVKSLNEVADFLNGLALQKYPPGNGPTLPIIKIAQLRKGDTEGADRCNTEVPVDYVVTDGDVLFSWSGSLECVLWAGGTGALNQHLFKVTSRNYPKWFYYFWIHEHLLGFRSIAADKATTMGHIQRHHLTDAKVVVPGAPALTAADCLISPLVKQLLALRTESRTLAASRDTLLPKLVSGETRVKDAEKFLEERGL